jgi:hypothetical protein
MRLAHASAGAALLLLSSGCTAIRSAAIPTGPLRFPARTGSVFLYTLDPPEVGIEIGYVEVLGSGDDATIEELLPVLVERVAQVGGDAAYLESVRTEFSPGLPTPSNVYGSPPSTSQSSSNTVSLVLRGRAYRVQVEP